MTMVAKSSIYFGATFKVQRGMTQGWLLSPTIVNVVVHAVLRHWVTVLTASEGGAAPDKEVLDSKFNGCQHIYILTTDSLHQHVNTATSGICHLDGSVWLVWDAHQSGKDGEYSVTTLSCNRGALCGGLWPQDDGIGSYLP